MDYIYQIFSIIKYIRYNFYDPSLWFIPMIIASFLGFSLRVTLSTCDQLWVKTFHNTMSFTMLPVITYVITTVISGNIPLALGMVGALSIVRFRHPVKNAFELVMYFALITIGIASSVKTQYAVGLTIAIIAIIVFFRFLEIFEKRRGKNIFPLSFSEGQSYSTLEVTLSKQINNLSHLDHLVQETHDEKENIHTYRYAALDKKTIIEKSNDISIKHKSDIINLTIDYN